MIRKVMWSRLHRLLCAVLDLRYCHKKASLKSVGISLYQWRRWRIGENLPTLRCMQRAADKLNVSWDYIQYGERSRSFEDWLALYVANEDKVRAFNEVILHSYNYVQGHFAHAELLISPKKDGPSAEINVGLTNNRSFRFRFYAKDRIIVSVSLDLAGMGRTHFDGEMSEFALQSGCAVIKRHVTLQGINAKQAARHQQFRTNNLKFLDRNNGRK